MPVAAVKSNGSPSYSADHFDHLMRHVSKCTYYEQRQT